VARRQRRRPSEEEEGEEPDRVRGVDRAAVVRVRGRQAVAERDAEELVAQDAHAVRDVDDLAVVDRDRDAARAWLEDPEIARELDFDIYFPEDGSPREFVRGDTNEDGHEGVSDAVYLLKFLFGPQPGRTPVCADALDVNDDGRLGTSDAIYLLQHLFIDSRRIPPPHDVQGFDRTPDDLPECGISLASGL